MVREGKCRHMSPQCLLRLFYELTFGQVGWQAEKLAKSAVSEKASMRPV
eukprot:CAMPEP_0183342946 /NCGR_PEP_ID=MMETSP0164_2-20130417/8953_1 /TAXON_ID=221442 /ORGANISM="Coccolithus pelagicus ssp braarudi, Strain PLY182g" /LENGTH=48 /DNA_ID= /DNA_START= /DNA_END= /DNA_ORIENTATION=